VVKAVANANKDISARSEGPNLGDELRQLQKLYPNKSGIRIRMRGEAASRKCRYARLHLLIESNGEVEYHQSGFEKRDAKSSAWWSNYFTTRVFQGIGGKSASPAKRLGVLEGAILPGLRRTTRLHWTVKMVIGYSLHDRR
jgi:hypothetical protein